MHSRHISLVSTLMVAMILQAAHASAQRGDAEVSGGYVYLRDPRTDLVFPQGWTIGGARRLGPVRGVVRFDRNATKLPLVVGDAELTMLALMAGASASLRIGPLRESAELLVGGVRARGILFGIESGASRAALQPGLNLDYLATETLALRVAFSDRILLAGRPWTHQVRAATELVYSFR